MSEPRVGQLAKISPKSEHYGRTEGNPKGFVGVIKEVRMGRDYLIEVTWGGVPVRPGIKCANDYRTTDLIYLT